MKAIKITILFIIFSIVSSCNSKEEIIGKWKRQNDQLAGLVIEVSKYGENMYIGKVTEVPDSLAKYQFQIGEIKWKDITTKEENKYEVKTLMKDYNSTTNAVTDPRYVDEYIEIHGDTLKTGSFIIDKNAVGNFQLWHKLK